MKPDRWYRIEQIFHAALQRKPEERPTFLNQSCGGESGNQFESGMRSG